MWWDHLLSQLHQHCPVLPGISVAFDLRNEQSQGARVHPPIFPIPVPRFEDLKGSSVHLRGPRIVHIPSCQGTHSHVLWQGDTNSLRLAFGFFDLWYSSVDKGWHAFCHDVSHNANCCCFDSSLIFHEFPTATPSQIQIQPNRTHLFVRCKICCFHHCFQPLLASSSSSSSRLRLSGARSSSTRSMLSPRPI